MTETIATRGGDAGLHSHHLHSDVLRLQKGPQTNPMLSSNSKSFVITMSERKNKGIVNSSWSG